MYRIRVTEPDQSLPPIAEVTNEWS
jgi:hypothetical protein